MTRHADDGTGRCELSDLLVSQCAGCLGHSSWVAERLAAEAVREPREVAEHDAPEKRPEEADYWSRPGVGVMNRLPGSSGRRIGRTFKSLYAGAQCAGCRQPIAKGALICSTTRGYQHDQCAS
jgi:hypothetical protein